MGKMDRFTSKHNFQGVLARAENSPVVIEVARQDDGQFHIYISYDVDSQKRKDINIKDVFLSDIREIMKLALSRMVLERREDEGDNKDEVVIIELRGTNKIEFI